LKGWEALAMDIPIPENDAERVAALHSYAILDTPPEQAFDDITELAAQICECPIAGVNMIDESRLWRKATYCHPSDSLNAPRDTTICATTVCRTDLLMVPDLTADERFSDSLSVTGAPHFRFYCGMPLINPEGYALGALCVLDYQTRELSFEQTEALRRLARQVVAQLELRRNLVELDEARAALEAEKGRLDEARRALEAEKAKSDELLRNILPAKIAEELKRGNRVEPRYYAAATIMFTDFKGFTQFAESMEPRVLVDELNRYFSAFDEIVSRHNLEKLKTIGDAYMCAGGLPEENRSHPVDACLAALEIQDFMARTNRRRETMGLPPWQLRIGIHTGPVMAGVVGKMKFTYDIWGDAVNIAALMESNGEAGRITLSESTYHRVKERFETEPRGKIEAKHKGRLETYFLVRLKPELART
jgi:class 3 adenylate cyclase